MDSTRRGIQSLRSSVIQLNASISDYKGWSFAQSYSLFDWFKKKLAETSRPTRWRSKTNRGLITRAFPCCASGRLHVFNYSL